MSKFKKGDTVRLNSGGPLMTIQEISQQYDNGKPLEGYDIRCRWFIKDEIQEAWFDQEALSADSGGSGPAFVVA